MMMMAMAEVPCLCARPSLAVPARPNATTAGRGVAAVRAAVVEAAAVVEDDEEEDAAVEERYALGGACRVLAGMPAPLGATALAGGVNFAVYSSGGATAARSASSRSTISRRWAHFSSRIQHCVRRAPYFWSAV